MSELEPDEPDILYRYMSCEGCKIKWLEQIFQESLLYFPKPSSFNDPFDCAVEICEEGSDEDKILHIYRIFRKCIPNSSDKELHDKAVNFIYSEAYEKMKKNFTKDLVKDAGVFCMSEIPDNILMWSHYADKHRGVCIGFNARSIDPFFGESQKVGYSIEYPKTNIKDSDIEKMKAIILTKSSDWAYEKEYRIIIPEHGNKLISFPNNLLAEIIIGCQAPKELREKVLSLAKNHPAKLKVFQAETAPREFKLLLKEL